jgi:pyridoxamine 5'-phosphate oxidase
MVLLKERTSRGFVFYTNLQSRKGRELAHGKAARLFYWRELGRQIRIEGRLEPVSEAVADDYFASRPRGSQVGAWASLQSEPLESKEILSARLMEVEALHGENPIPRPAHWSGTEVIAERIEFWQAGEFRLHDRFEFSLRSGQWNPPVRLFP